MREKTMLLSASLVAATLVLAVAVALLVLAEHAEAAFPGKTGKIVFTSYLSTGEGVDNPEGDSEIFAINPDGTGLIQVTRNATYESEPVWSPDGTRVAFVRSDGHDNEIYTISTGGGEPTQVTDNEYDDHEPAWSPGGSKIAYVGEVPDDPATLEYDPKESLHTIPTSGGQPTLVYGGYGDVNDPTWSPGGTKIAFGSGKVWTVPASGGPLTAVTRQQVVWSDYGIDWSPDGSKITYVADDDEPVKPGYADSEIWVISVNGGTLTDVTDDRGYWEQYTPAWSPDGTKITFTDQHDAIYTINAAGGTPTKVVEGLGVQSDLDWGVAPAIKRPASKAECKNGGYRTFGFKNQGRCVFFVHSGTRNSS